MCSFFRRFLCLGAAVALTAALPLVGCSDDGGSGRPDAGGDGGAMDGGLPPRGDCEALTPETCALPFPSSYFLEEDATTATGYRVRLGDTTLPVTLMGHQLSGHALDSRDGFSINAAPLTQLPGATQTGLPRPDSIARSLQPDSPTVLLNADTGERVPHFAQIDVRAAAGTGRAFIVRPVVPLDHDTDYVVAIRDVVDASGDPLAPSLVFQALRDGTDDPDPYVQRRRDHFETLFDTLAAAGIERSSLQLAWDFHTASEEDDTGRVLAMRDDAMATLGSDGPAYTIDSVTPDPDADTAIEVRGTMTVPWYLDAPGPGGQLVLDANGVPQQNGTAEVPFIVTIPKSATAASPALPLQVGHGLFGTHIDAISGSYRAFANAYGYALFSTDFIGMAQEDIGEVLRVLVSGDIEDFATVPDRLDQSMVNAMFAARLMTGAFAQDAAVTDAGSPLIDTSGVVYLGESEAGIFGGTYMSLSTDVTRGVLRVPGQPYNLLLMRSEDFDEFHDVILTSYHDGPDVLVLLSVMQQLWDRAEPGAFTRHLVTDPFPGTPAHRVLLQVAIGDHQVSPLAAHVMARSIGVPQLEPENRTLFGIDTVGAPYDGSAMVEYDFMSTLGTPPVPLDDTPNRDGGDPHEAITGLPAADQQTDDFLRTGIVEQHCTGTCDPE